MDPRLSRGLVCSLAALLLTLAASVGVQGQDDEYITCYNYTWTGKNVSVDCEDHKTDIMNEEQPCLYTLVYTVPPESPPNVTDLENQCSTVQKCPSYTCKAKGKKCIKLSWYDITNRLVNYSSFCGTVTDVTDPTSTKEVKNDVVLEMEVGTHTKRLMMCSKSYCNAAGTLGGSPGTMALSALLVLLVVLLVPPTGVLRGG